MLGGGCQLDSESAIYIYIEKDGQDREIERETKRELGRDRLTEKKTERAGQIKIDRERESWTGRLSERVRERWA